jgi:hypothetical protein
VTSHERRGRADGPAFNRRDFTTAARENQPAAGAGQNRTAEWASELEQHQARPPFRPIVNNRVNK